MKWLAVTWSSPSMLWLFLLVPHVQGDVTLNATVFWTLNTTGTAVADYPFAIVPNPGQVWLLHIRPYPVRFCPKPYAVE